MTMLLDEAKLLSIDFKNLHPISIRHSKTFSGVNMSFLTTTDEYEVAKVF